MRLHRATAQVEANAAGSGSLGECPEAAIASADMPAALRWHGCRPRGRLRPPNGDRLANLECHQIFAQRQRPAIGLPRFGENIVDGRRRNSFAANQDNVRIGRKLGFCLSEDAAGLAWRRMVPDDPLDVGFLHELRPRARNLMHQQVGAGAIIDDILVVARVAGEYCGAPKAITVTGLDDVSVVDLERDDRHAVLLVDHAVAIELDDICRDPRKRQLLVGDPNLDIERVGPLQVLHQRARAARSDHAVRRLTRAHTRMQPAGEPYVRDARGVVGVIVGEQLHIDPADRNLELMQPDGRAAAGIDQEFLLAGLDQRAGAETVRARDRHAGPEQCHPEVGTRHELILIPASLMTLDQCAISVRTSVPNASGEPPPGSTPSLARASRTLSVLIALLMAALSCAITGAGVPDFTKMPAQSSLASFG